MWSTWLEAEESCQVVKFTSVSQKEPSREEGMAMGQDGAKGWGYCPYPGMVLFCPIPAMPRMTGKNFSPHPRPLGPREAPPHLVKLYFLLIFPTTSIIFLMKPISLIKIYLKLQLNLSHQIKSIFRKKFNNISKCLTRKSPKKKTNSITQQNIGENYIR